MSERREDYYVVCYTFLFPMGHFYFHPSLSSKKITRKQRRSPSSFFYSDGGKECHKGMGYYPINRHSFVRDKETSMIKIENLKLLKFRCHENANYIVHLDRISHLTTVFSFFHFFLLSEMKTLSQRHLYDSPYLFHDKAITSFSDSRRH